MAGYVFLSNSNKPTEEEQNSREPISLTNVSKPCLEVALNMGYDVWLGINRENPDTLSCDLPVHMYDSHTYRSIFNLKDNITAYKNLMFLLKHEKIEVIHCNTPVGGIIGRICGKRAGVKKVIYTAHGFHFYKGAPFINRTFFKWAEMLMARWTDAIITLNHEDYNAAKKFKLRNLGKVYYVPGVGIDLSLYQHNDSSEANVKKRVDLGLKETDFVLISVGRLDKNKNNRTLIEAVSKCENQSIHLVICGDGEEQNMLQQLASELGIKKRIHFLGNRTDMNDLYQVSNVFVMASFREGLSRSMMEAMASGLPCIVSKIRGNVDLLEDGKGGYLVEATDAVTISKRLDTLARDSNLRTKMALTNLERIKKFDVNEVKKIIGKIYQEVLE